jgi:hypothetical protein
LHRKIYVDSFDESMQMIAFDVEPQTIKVSVGISSLDTQQKDPRSIASRICCSRRTRMEQIHEFPWEFLLQLHSPLAALESVLAVDNVAITH